MITVLIPTAKRPELLVNALRSVAEQTALSEIGQIIVSESAGDRRSEEVCRQFPNLPIRYIFREPPLPMTEHFSALKREKWPGEFAAILHDDDWWAPEHLSVALEALRAQPEAVGYCCNCYELAGERSPFRCGSTSAFWFGADYPEQRGVWKLGLKGAMLGLLIETAATYSSMVIRTEILPRAATAVYATGNNWDADRMLLGEVAALGPLLFCPVPHLFYRLHAQQITHALKIRYREEQFKKTTEWLINRAGETWESAGRLFAEKFERCPPGARHFLHEYVMQPSCLPLLAAKSGSGTMVGRLYARLNSKRIRPADVAREILPPVIFKSLRRLLAPGSARFGKLGTKN